MSSSFSEAEAARHNALYKEACELHQGLLLLDGVSVTPLGFFARRKLRKSIALFQEALEINPTGWTSMLFIGKAFQRLNKLPEALAWFRRAHELVPTNPAVSKEAGLTAGQLGEHNLAIQIMSPAASEHPDDVVLQINLGLSYLLSGQTTEACEAFERASQLEPDRSMNSKLAKFARKVHDGHAVAPKTEAELLKMI